ncbi:MAG: hypothetical protein WDA27_01805 [Actinomycetota bacterium]
MLNEAVRRRSVWLLTGAFLVVLGGLAFSSYSDLRMQRHFRDLARTTTRISAGMGVCDSGMCYHPGFGLDPGKVRDLPVSALRVVFSDEFDQLIAVSERRLAPLQAAAGRARTTGSAVGVVWAVLVGAVLAGRDWTGRTWPTVLVHMPDRGRAYLARLRSILTVVGGVYVCAQVLLAAEDWVLRIALDVGGAGRLGVRAYAGDVVAGLVVVLVYACLAALSATVGRSAVAGLAMPLLLLLGDGLLTRGAGFFRYVLPAQSVASLFHDAAGRAGPAIWWPLSRYTTCGPPVGCREFEVAAFRASHSFVVLGVWVALAAWLGIVTMRNRDVPAGTL